MNDALLALLQKGLGHDLPNHLVAIQGLAHLLEIDQAERLDDEGKDYLRRLAGAARKAHEQVLGLAALIRAERSGLAGDTAGVPGEAAPKALSPGPEVGYHGPQIGTVNTEREARKAEPEGAKE